MQFDKTIIDQSGIVNKWPKRLQTSETNILLLLRIHLLSFATVIAFLDMQDSYSIKHFES